LQKYLAELGFSGYNLWQGTAAADNRFEYFANGVSIFYGASSTKINNGMQLSNRKELVQYDPDLAALIADVFKHTQRTDWRYGISSS